MISFQMEISLRVYQKKKVLTYNFIEIVQFDSLHLSMCACVYIYRFVNSIPRYSRLIL